MDEDKNFAELEKQFADDGKWEEVANRIDFRDKTGDAFADRHIAPHLRRHAADVTREEWNRTTHTDSDNMAFEAAMKARYGDLVKD